MKCLRVMVILFGLFSVETYGQGNAQKLYIMSRNRVFRSNLDGSDFETLYYNPVNATQDGAMALDMVHGYIYWTEVSTQSLHRIRIDGSNHETLLPQNSLLSNPVGLSLDLNGGKTYIIDGTQIKRFNLDGSNVEEAFQLPNLPNGTGGVAIAIDRPLAGVPAVGTVGLGVMAVLVVGGGALILARRRIQYPVT